MKTNQDLPITYAMYVRKSTEDPERQVQSIKDQLEVLSTLTERKSISVKPSNIFQESKSAKRPNNRPEFNRLIEAIEAGKIQGIIVWKLDRLSRNPVENGILQQLLQDHKIRHIMTNDRDYKPEDNAIIFSVEAGMSNQYIRELSSNVKRGMRATVREGRVIGIAPAGYINRQIDKRRFIEKDPERWHIIRKGFDMFLTGNYTVAEVAAMINETGYRSIKRTKIGGKPMSRSGLNKILVNRRYMGWVPHPDFPDDPDKDSKADFDAMITEDEFNQVQTLLFGRGCKRNVSKKSFELRGLLKCGECNCSITAHTARRKLKDGTTNYHTYYHCTKKKSGCQQKVISEKALSEQLDTLLSQYEISPVLYEWGLKAIKDIASSEIESRDDIQKAQFATISEIQAQLDSLVDLVTDGTIAADTYKRKAAPLEAELAHRQQQQHETANRVKNWYEIIGHTLERLSNATDKFRIGDLSTRRDILLSIGYNPILINNTVVITPNPWLIPMAEALPSIKTELAKVITESENCNDASATDREQKLVSQWCG